MNEIKEYTDKIFENIKHIDESGNEYWLARELGKTLEYSEYRKFFPSIKKAIISCEKSALNIENHFAQMDVMVKIGSNAKRILNDYRLTRYACYLIVQNSDSSKPVVALGQTYFAIQTRKQELFEKEYNELSEDEKRIYQRNLTKKHNKSLNQTAKEAGVKNFDKFHNAGYKGLYNGETADDIARRKGLRYREDILDNMGSEELVDNLFRITHTDSKLKNDKIKGEAKAIKTHYEVGKKVRETIKELNGTMPEDLPKPNKSLKELEKDKQLFIVK
ncbi:MAG: DNA damage-inducible protein D [Bacilli bacterium]|nr:DNA damage-inducible protein D [Bacilli bacterium]